ncbi:hypothetical protein [Beijerinckia sp. L45]|uniref:hypothetical protein n=1 Tax=Beijerinckia sp. L45 TaxID=1641855 RepID=UPI00131E1BFD|nr:hypothetical protein [Beijerinckia sp. L45]
MAAGAALWVAVMGPAVAQDSSRWAGSYAGGDLGDVDGNSQATVGGAPCHIGCRSSGPQDLGAHAGYGTNLGSGFVGGIEGDIGSSGR